MKKVLFSAVALIGFTVALYGANGIGYGVVQGVNNSFEKYGPCRSAVLGAQNALTELGYDEGSAEWSQISAKVWQNCVNHIDG
ncbi:MAG: hypothetical protein WCY06_04035 [Flavobacteriaceae bacterium]